jgi:ribonuclease P protein component
MKQEGLPGSERLRGRAAIQGLMGTGLSVENKLLVLKYQPSQLDPPRRRIAVAVSRSTRGAVPRNRVRRRLREIYRHRRNLLPASGDFLLIAKSAAYEASYTDLEESFLGLSRDLAD